MKIYEAFCRFKLRIRLLFTRDPNKRKVLLIAIALTTAEGRRKLAEAMVEPIRNLCYFKEFRTNVIGGNNEG